MHMFNKSDNFLNIYRKYLYEPVFNVFISPYSSCVLQISLTCETPRNLEPAVNYIASRDHH